MDQFYEFQEPLGLTSTQNIYIYIYIHGENTILVPIFWSHSQFSPYILVAINLVPVIFNLQST